MVDQQALELNLRIISKETVRDTMINGLDALTRELEKQTVIIASLTDEIDELKQKQAKITAHSEEKE